ncbi:hypothetical protein BDZ94DRAFT_1353136 [Collybia nuda]|uniref:Ribonuclease H1 N-terminal domain-containing protein n=1 Tax=Collybia nuda TaxID=64659 RepID=A0A9P6C8B0_9AGAR|nr:hypothetical protein BDZ94DRAFT_1353136 [Collybia nuda]
MAPQVAPTKTYPIVVISDDESDTNTNTPIYFTAATNTTEDTVDTTDSEDKDTKEPVPDYDLTCAVCGTTFELLRRKSQPWYAVFVGRKVGIYQSYKDATDQINGVTEGLRRHYPTFKAAKKAYRHAQCKEQVKVRYSKKEMLGMQDNAELERQKEVTQSGAIAIYYSSN